MEHHAFRHWRRHSLQCKDLLSDSTTLFGEQADINDMHLLWHKSHHMFPDNLFMSPIPKLNWPQPQFRKRMSLHQDLSFLLPLQCITFLRNISTFNIIVSQRAIEKIHQKRQKEAFTPIIFSFQRWGLYLGAFQCLKGLNKYTAWQIHYVNALASTIPSPQVQDLLVGLNL